MTECRSTRLVKVSVFSVRQTLNENEALDFISSVMGQTAIIPIRWGRTGFRDMLWGLLSRRYCIYTDDPYSLPFPRRFWSKAGHGSAVRGIMII